MNVEHRNCILGQITCSTKAIRCCIWIREAQDCRLPYHIMLPANWETTWHVAHSESPNAQHVVSNYRSQTQARYLKQFRADNIVRDAEAIRLALTQGLPEPRRKWSLMGQSFGGFCCISYLSMFPASLREAFITGGLPPLVDSPEEVYQRLFKKLVKRNVQYYEKFPQVKIALLLHSHGVS